MLQNLLLLLIVLEMASIGLVLYNVIRMRKNIEKVTSDPKFMGEVLNNMIFGFMARIKNSEEDQEKFFGFISVCGMAAWEGVKTQISGPKADGTPGAGLDGIDLSFLPKKMRGLVQLMDHPLVKGIIDKQMNQKGSGETNANPLFGL